MPSTATRRRPPRTGRAPRPKSAATACCGGSARAAWAASTRPSTPPGRRVALKLISADFAASPAAVERFRREGRLASGVSHPRCVFVLAADEAAGRPYIVMELMPGTTLQDLVDRDGPMPIEKAISKISDVIDGLREAHRLGVVHRDVKPSNCFLDADGRVKIGDFGLSKSLVASDRADAHRHVHRHAAVRGAGADQGRGGRAAGGRVFRRRRRCTVC